MDPPLTKSSSVSGPGPVDGRLHAIGVRRLGRVCGGESAGRAVSVPGEPHTQGTAHGKAAVGISL